MKDTDQFSNRVRDFYKVPEFPSLSDFTGGTDYMDAAKAFAEYKQFDPQI